MEDDGFTFVEIIVAVAILSTMVVALMFGLGGATTASGHAIAISQMDDELHYMTEAVTAAASTCTSGNSFNVTSYPSSQLPAGWASPTMYAFGSPGTAPTCPSSGGLTEVTVKAVSPTAGSRTTDLWVTHP